MAARAACCAHATRGSPAVASHTACLHRHAGCGAALDFGGVGQVLPAGWRRAGAAVAVAAIGARAWRRCGHHQLRARSTDSWPPCAERHCCSWPPPAHRRAGGGGGASGGGPRLSCTQHRAGLRADRSALWPLGSRKRAQRRRVRRLRRGWPVPRALGGGRVRCGRRLRRGRRAGRLAEQPERRPMMCGWERTPLCCGDGRRDRRSLHASPAPSAAAPSSPAQSGCVGYSRVRVHFTRKQVL